MKYNAVIFDWGDTLADHGKVPDFAIDLVRKLFLSGYRLGIISNSHRYGDARWLRRKLGELDLTQYFEVVISSGGTLGVCKTSCQGTSSGGCHKPDHAIYWKALNFLGVEPERCVFVGDSFRCDILGTQTLGMSALHIHVSENYSQRLWGLLEDTFKERLNIITTYSSIEPLKVQFAIKDLTEPLIVGCPIILGQKEWQVLSFSENHTKQDILANKEDLITVELGELNSEPLNSFSGIANNL